MAQVVVQDVTQFELQMTQQEATDLRKKLIGDASANVDVITDIIQELTDALPG